MGIHTCWDSEDKTIIRRNMSGIWTWDEFIESCQVEHQMALSVAHDVYLIIDVRHSLSVPAGGLIHFRQALESSSDEIQMNVVVGANLMFRTIHQILMQMLPQFIERVILVKDMDEAYALIEKTKQKTLPHLPS